MVLLTDSVVYYFLPNADISLLYILHTTNVKTEHIGLYYSHIQ